MTNLESAILLETIVTTIDAAGTPHAAAMGPRVATDLSQLLLRPFAGTTTLSNLQSTRVGVMHITDDVQLIARSALGLVQESPPTLKSIPQHECPRLADCCRWYSFRVECIDTSEARSRVVAKVIDNGRVRDFLGFNRAKHAVIEAAIMATRLHLLPAEEIAGEIRRLGTIVDKTAGVEEHAVFEMVRAYIAERPSTTGEEST